MKYNITFSCGHTGEVTLYGKGKDREAKIAWYESSGLCPDCYKEEMRQKEKEEGLTVSVYVNVLSSFLGKDSDRDLAFVFSGDSYSYKDKLKEMNAEWTRDYPSNKFIKDLLNIDINPLRWVLYTSIDKFEETYNEVVKIANVKELPSKINLKFFIQEKQKVLEKQNKMNEELQLLGKIPSWPEELLEKCSSDVIRWNERFYGKEDSWKIYISGEKIDITNELKQQMEEISLKRKEWRNKKEEIKEKYK